MNVLFFAHMLLSAIFNIVAIEAQAAIILSLSSLKQLADFIFL